MVPKIRNVDQKKIKEIANELKEISDFTVKIKN